ncbi:MAG: hypothetical protein ACR2HF_08950 [Methylococcaceae bacterium]
MINVIHGGGDAFDSILYAQQNPANQYYIQQQLERINTTLTDSGRAFMSACNEIYQQVNSSEAMQLARSALRAAKSLFQPNVIQYLDTLEQIQTAPPIMQRWVMSCPDIRALYQQQRCHGYGEAYTTDFSPNKIGDADYNYRRVMDGVVVVEEAEEGWTWYSRQYAEDLLEGDRELSAFERLDVIRTWDIVRMAIEAGDDPTHQEGGSL